MIYQKFITYPNLTLMETWLLMWQLSNDTKNGREGKQLFLCGVKEKHKIYKSLVFQFISCESL